jgi:hypothetical protein
MLKRCSICKVEKKLSNFHLDKHTKDGRYPSCKDCRNTGIPTLRKLQRLVARNKLVVNNPDNKICYQCCLEKPRNKFRGNKNTCIDCHYKTCNKCGLTKHITEYEMQRAVCKACKNAAHRQRVKTDPVFKLRKNLSHYIARALSDQGLHKRMSFLKAIEYTMQELYIHLEKQFEPWMNWENYGAYKADTWNDNDPTTWTWQLDHIIPHSEFPYTSMCDDNFKKCWALDNLRPLSSKQNLVDGATKIRHSS